MIKISTMPIGTLAELLLFLAENERFQSVSEKLGGGLTIEETCAALRELARELMREAKAQGKTAVDEARANAPFSPRAKKIISCLSPNEESTLFTAFGLVGKDK